MNVNEYCTRYGTLFSGKTYLLQQIGEVCLKSVFSETRTGTKKYVGIFTGEYYPKFQDLHVTTFQYISDLYCQLTDGYIKQCEKIPKTFDTRGPVMWMNEEKKTVNAKKFFQVKNIIIYKYFGMKT